MNVRDIGEIGLIKRLTRDIGLDRSVIKGAGDDAAVIAWTAKKYLLYTCDMLVEDVHFKRHSLRSLRSLRSLGSATPFQIGWKALGRNISDIAAMGGIPRYAVVSIALPAAIPVRFVDGVYRGMKSLSSKFGVNIVGGDVSRSEKVVINVALIGEVEKTNLVTRGGAKKGDVIFVTGSIGGSIKGKHLDFMPRVDEARGLVKNFKVHSMIDVTDGLFLDLWRVLDASGAGATIYKNRVPISRSARSFNSAVRDGEDFELLFTMGPKDAKELVRKKPAIIKTTVSAIGEITDKSRGYSLVREDQRAEKIATGAGERVLTLLMLSKSIDETISIGAKLGKSLVAGDVVALIGDLGAGKTVFTKGIAQGLGVKNVRYVNSPTFVIIKEYKGKLPLYHFDLYRLNKSGVLDAENFEEYFYGDGVAVVEWADKILTLLPKRHIEVRLSVSGEGKRKIVIRKSS